MPHEKRSMFESHPDLALDFHPSRNGEATIYNTRAGTGKKLWWLCRTCQHEWPMSGNSRTSADHGCGACSHKAMHSSGRDSILHTHPDVAALFDTERNAPLRVEDVRAGKNDAAWWRCTACSTSWSASVRDRSRGEKPCPRCRSLKTTHPELAAAFDVEKNRPVQVDQVVAGTASKLWWLCPECNNSWSAAGHSRVRGSGCPACAGQRLHSDGRNSMARVAPRLAASFNRERNKPHTPENLMPGSHIKLWWSCETCGCAWRAKASDRFHGNNGCSSCFPQYNATEHLFNTCAKLIFGECVDIKPGMASRVKDPEGTDGRNHFQVDARLHIASQLVAFLYDGMGGHRNNEESTALDAKRRTALTSAVTAVLVLRHGPPPLSLGIENYIEVRVEKHSPLIPGVRALVEAFLSIIAPKMSEAVPEAVLNTWRQNAVSLDNEHVFSEAARTWDAIEGSNPDKLLATIERERGAIRRAS